MTTARDLANASAAAVKAHDRAAWLALFAEDAVVEDPVGPSVLDPEGKGNRGKAAIARFYDMAIGPNKDVTFEIHRSILCGDELANVVTLHIVNQQDQKLELPAVICYRKSPDGKIASLRAFWEATGIPGFG